MGAEMIQPEGWPRASGYSYGTKVGGGETLYISGQVPKDASGRLVGRGDIVIQFDQTLANLTAVLRAAGGEATDLVMLRIYVTNLDAYRNRLREIGEAYRRHLERHYPAMTLVGVKGLIEEDQLVEIEGVAVIPLRRDEGGPADREADTQAGGRCD